eukprot:s628_g10.t3
MLSGVQGPVSLVSWSTHKLRRVCRSSLAAEAQALAECEAELFLVRGLWQELLGAELDLVNPWNTTKQTPGVLVIDAKALYDTLKQQEVPNLGAKEKHTALEVLGLSQHLVEQETTLRWCNSDQQLADGMTKISAQDRVTQFLKGNQRWNLVYDETFTAAKKLKSAKTAEDGSSEYRDQTWLEVLNQTSGHVRNPGIEMMEDGQVSSLAPWIRILPSEEMLKEYHVAYASDSVLETFAALPLTSRVQHWKQSVCNVWQDRKSEFMDVSFDAFKWAATILQTRDMMNTSLTPNMEVYDSLELEEAPEDITNSPASASSNMGYYGLLPLREIMQGEELTQAYCAVDNSERLFRCGFLLPENPTAVEPLSRRSVEAMCPAGKPLRGATRGLRALNIATLRRHLQRHGADLEEATLGPCEGPKGLGMYARRPITKGEVVASVPRGLVLEAPLLGAAPPSDTLPLAAAAGGHGQWYDVLGSASGRRSAVKLAKRVVEEEEKGPKVGVD